jgi:putative ABC transport system permease protein
MSIQQDIRLAARMLRRTPGFTAVTLVTLALGIGATSAMFSIFNAVLLRPLPWREPDRAVMIWSRWTAFDKTWLATGEVVDYRRRSTTLEAIAAWGTGQVNVTGAADPERVGSAAATANLFEVLGARPARGRTFTRQEDLPNGPRVAIISHEIWRRRYAGAPGILGRGIELNGEGYEIVGVLPPGFRLPTDFDQPEPTEVITALQMDPNSTDHGSHGLYGAARLKPGVTVQQASSELEGIARAMTREGLYPEAMQFGAFAVALDEEVVGTVRPAVFAVFGAVACLLLIACANVANLMLARADGRSREMAVRSALGASRGDTLRLLLVEALFLSLTAGVAGLALSALSVRWVAWWNPAGIPRLADARVDLPVALFTLAVASVVAILFSIAPLLRALRLDLNDQLRDGSQSATAGVVRQRFRAGLIVAETALAVVLLVGAGLMLRSLAGLQRIDLGFEPSNVITMRVSVPAATYDSPEQVVNFFRALVQRTRALPGVRDAAAVRSLPLASEIGDFGLTVDGYVPPPGQNAKGDWQIATDGYLEALGERLVRGRAIRAEDDENAMLVALVNEEMARRYWAGVDPIGRRFRIGMNPSRPWVTVVGLVRDVRHNGVTDVIKEKFYVPHAQWHKSVGFAQRSMYIVARADGDPEALVPSIRAELRALDPAIPLASVMTMEDVVDTSLSTPRFTSALFTIFSALAVLLAAIGLYGVLSYLVTQRTREIGIRLAIGASPRDVSRLVLLRGIVLAGSGVLLGAAGAFALGRAVAVLLYDVPPHDPPSFAIGTAVLLAAAALASYIPARRATAVDPVLALKAE